MRNSSCETNIWRPRQALDDVANIVKPETILGWYRKLVAKKFDGSKARGVGHLFTNRSKGFPFKG